MMRTDEELLVAASSGDSTALSEFYDRHSKLIYGALLRILQDTDDAENTLMEVFVQVRNKASMYKPELGPPKRWLLQLTQKCVAILTRSEHYRPKNIEIPIPEVLIRREPVHV